MLGMSKKRATPPADETAAAKPPPAMRRLIVEIPWNTWRAFLAYLGDRKLYPHGSPDMASVVRSVLLEFLNAQGHPPANHPDEPVPGGG